MLSKTFCVSLIYQTHVGNGWIEQFFDHFTLKLDFSVKIIAILCCISLVYVVDFQIEAKIKAIQEFFKIKLFLAFNIQCEQVWKNPDT